MEQDNTSKINTATNTGATISNTYVARQVTVYAVLESEVETLTSFNTQVTTFLSVGFALLSFAAGILTNALFNDSLPPQAAVATKVGVPVLGILSVVFFWLAYSVWAKRKATISVIKEQSASKTLAQ